MSQYSAMLMNSNVTPIASEDARRWSAGAALRASRSRISCSLVSRFCISWWHFVVAPELSLVTQVEVVADRFTDVVE